MKQFLLFTFWVLTASVIYAQWTPTPVGNANTQAVSLASYIDTVLVGFAGDGIYRTDDLGNSWQDISGNLSNKNVNTIQAGPWPSIFISTNDGAFFTIDQADYTAASTSGLDNADVSIYFVGGDLETNKFVIGTKGGGFYYGPELTGPWTAASNGLSGDALTINTISGYRDEEVSNYILGTNGGVYYSSDDFGTWVDGSNGLTGAQLEVTGVLLLNTFSIITTHGGVFMSMDYGQNWSPVIPDEKFNVLLLRMDQESGFMLFLLGETAYFTSDLVTITPFDIPGEVISAAATSTELFIATSADSRNGNESGGLYHQPLNWIITALPETEIDKKMVKLEQNYPNPFSGSTTISYTLLEKQKVEMRVYDMLGREVALLEYSLQDAGKHEVVFNAATLLRGVYHVVLKLENGSTSNIKMIKE